MDQFTELKIRNAQLKAEVKRLRRLVIIWMVVSLALVVVSIFS